MKQLWSIAMILFVSTTTVQGKSHSSNGILNLHGINELYYIMQKHSHCTVTRNGTDWQLMGSQPITNHCLEYQKAYVSLRLRVQNRRKKWNFPLNFRTMRKLSDLYSGIFQTQSSGCASGVNYFRNFTKLKNLNF